MGARRTGTTLVNQILCNDARANAHVGECQLLARLCDDFRWSQANYDRLVQWYFRDKKESTEYFRQIIEQFIEVSAQNLGHPEFLVLKAPLFSNCKQQLNELLPEAKSIVCIRNPFDQVASEFEVGQRQLEQGINNLVSRAARNRDVATLAERYLETYQKLERYMDSNDLMVRFEDVIENLDHELRKIENHTGMDLSGYDRESTWKRFEYEQEIASMPAHVEQYGSRLDGSRVGRFNDALSPGESSSIKEICAQILDKYYKEYRDVASQ